MTSPSDPLPIEQCDRLECPFCAGTDIRFTNHGTKKRRFGDTHTDAMHYGGTIWSTCCYQCGATFPNMYSREKIEEKWRQRPATRPQHDREAIAPDIEAIRTLLITATRTVYKTADIRKKSDARATIMAKLPALLDELERLRSA